MARDREKQRVYMQEYNQRNREKNLKYEKERYQADPEKFRARTRAYRKANPEKVAAQLKAYRLKNKEKLKRQRDRNRTPEKTRRALIRRKYHLTPEVLTSLLEAQDNACAICRRPFDESVEAHIDHQHGGDVRGVLCLKCNAGLGLFGDDVWLMAEAIQYLMDPPARGLLTPQLALFDADETMRVQVTATKERVLKGTG
jgi:hypothetical protein